MQHVFAPPTCTPRAGQPGWRQTMLQALALLGLGLGGIVATALDD